MLLRILAVVAGLLGITGIGLALLLANKPNTPPIQQTAVAAAPVPQVAPPAMSHILVAARPLRAGALLVMADIGSLAVPAGKEPPGSYMDTVGARATLRGSMVRRSLNANETLLAGDVLNPGDRGFLAAVLGAGMRAVTIGVDPVSGLSGLVWPGDHVDVVLTQAIDDKDQPIERRISGETVLSDVRVIAVDQQLVEGAQSTLANSAAVGGSNRTVTLEATPFDAERVAVAARLGRLSLLIRSAADDVPGLASQAPRTAWSGDVSAALPDKRGTIYVNHGKNVEEVHY